MTAQRVLADWAASYEGSHSDLALSRAKGAFLDTIACILLGAKDPAVAAVTQVASAWGAGQATVIGGSLSLPAPWAALANGTAGHAFDYDDYEDAGNTHPSAVLVPALLALAEERAAAEDNPSVTDGAALLDAYIVGLEVLMRVGEAVNLSHYAIGWHSTATVGAIGAAAACGRLLGLDGTRMAHAIGLSVSMAAGVQAQFGTMAKPLHAGMAAKAGVLAARLAEAGATASPDALDGPQGFVALQGGPGAKGFAEPLAKLGKPLGIEAYGLTVKLHPCCGYTHRSADAVIQLRGDHDLRPDQVRRITARLPSDHLQILLYRDPQNPMQARFCLAYCLSVALLKGRLEVSDFVPDAIHRSDLRSLMERVAVESHPPTPLDAVPADWPADVVTIDLDDGRSLETEVSRPRGSPELPASEAELEAKFRACAERVLARDKADMLLLQLDELERLEDVAALMKTLRI